MEGDRAGDKKANGAKTIKVHYTCVWKHHNKIYYFIQHILIKQMGKRGGKVYPSNPLKNNQEEKYSLLKILEFLRSNWTKWNNKSYIFYYFQFPKNTFHFISIITEKIHQYSKGINWSCLKVAYNSMYKSTEFLTGVEWAHIHSMKSWAVSPRARAHRRENRGKEGSRRRG